MFEQIQIICLPLPFNFGSVNCYLVKTGTGYILIDTGYPTGRAALEKELERAGCRPGNLSLIVITHGDFDHMGSAAYLRKKYDTQIAMHPCDAGMAERGDMFWGRKGGNRLIGRLAALLLRFSQADRFTPDVLVQDGDELTGYGWNARVLEVPGHTAGSISLLSENGELFCGDLLMNDKAAPTVGLGDPLDFRPSLDRVKGMEIAMIYPGHGAPFNKERIP